MSSEASLSAREGRAGELIGRARELIPLLDRSGDEIERTRRIPGEALDALHDARLFRLTIPRSCAGEEVDPATLFHVLEAIAQGDASVAWCLGQAAGVSMGAAYLKPEVAQAVFGDPRAVAASGPHNAHSQAVVCDGGYRISGEWNFASGSKHATWLFGHAIVCERDGEPRRGADGRPLAARTLIFRKSDAVVSDVWDVIGLRGTASDNYSTSDLFVPADFSFTRDSDEDRRESGPLYRFSVFNIFGLGFAGVALGLARRMLDEFIALAMTKTPHGMAMKLCDNNVVQSQVGLAQARIDASRAHVLQTFQALYAAAGRGERFDKAMGVGTRAATAYAIHQAREVVDTIYHAAGSTAIFKESPFERRFRDIHTLTQQGQAAFANFEALGRAMMGRDPIR